MSELETLLEKIRVGNSQVFDINKIVREAIEKNPEAVKGVQKFLSIQLIRVGFAVGCFDMGIVSLGLSLQNVFGTIAWIPLSITLLASSFIILLKGFR
ncbi:hypothetical protein [Thermofilum sp.]|uniref:hypothetical protein n=1 Tax=Thermofilum sp. TaxID=1961369 RepID=UPI00316D6666